MFCLLLVYTSIVQPLRTIQKTIRAYTVTKDSRAVEKNLSEVHPHNEIGQLSEDVMLLTKEIDDYTKQIASITEVLP